MIAQSTRGNGIRDEVVQTACELTRVVYNSAAMEPRIQYAKTADGVSIAFYAIGQGRPLVYMQPHGVSHLQFEWQIPQLRQAYERAARRNTYVRYDPRGFGLSDRDVIDFSVTALVRDLEAVADHLGLGRFQLVATHTAAPVAIAYAARCAERLSHLILWCGWARASDWLPERLERLETLLEKDWELYTETASYSGFGFSQEDPLRQGAALMRESVTPHTFLSFLGQAREWDVSGLLPSLAVPTLVLHRRQYRTVGVDVARRLASAIPDARFVLLEGSSIMMGPDTNAAIGAFLRESEAPTSQAEPPAAGAFRTVLFTDVEGSTALTQRLGDAKARQVLREHERITREALRAHGGTEVKSLGDGFMACFSSATRALECAIAMQRAFADHNEALLRQAQDEHTEPVEVRVRIGLNAGEPIEEDEDLFGTAVILAARIAAKAEGGEIVVSDTVRGLVAGKGFLFSDQGDVVLRGFEDPVRLYEVRWRENA
jgi:class 3 adenylate cyclase/pimeloyl-ACP methyl ester carboxylesterase